MARSGGSPWRSAAGQKWGAKPPPPFSWVSGREGAVSAHKTRRFSAPDRKDKIQRTLWAGGSVSSVLLDEVSRAGSLAGIGARPTSRGCTRPPRGGAPSDMRKVREKRPTNGPKHRLGRRGRGRGGRGGRVRTKKGPSCIQGRFLFCSCLPLPRKVRGRVRAAIFQKQSVVVGRFRPRTGGNQFFIFILALSAAGMRET